MRPGKVGIYLCGPTVYDKAHIGHMVGPVIFDCIKRYLDYCGYDVTWVVNITDVDDKLIKKANERGISMLEVAEENIADYNGNLAALGVDQIDHFPRATECMPEIIEFVEVPRSSAASPTSRTATCISTSARTPSTASSRIARSNRCKAKAARRRRAQAARRRLRAVESGQAGRAVVGQPVGRGPAGLAHRMLGDEQASCSAKRSTSTAAGSTSMFPHHENEIAQSECCHDKPMVTLLGPQRPAARRHDERQNRRPQRTRRRRGRWQRPVPRPKPSAAK